MHVWVCLVGVGGGALCECGYMCVHVCASAQGEVYISTYVTYNTPGMRFIHSYFIFTFTHKVLFITAQA